MYEMENVSFEEIESSQRLQQLAVEIITFDRQAKITAVSCAIEIGERLLEAKDLVPHGEWGKWLKENVNYSQSTANNFMRLYREYGSDQGSLFTTAANSQAIMNLDVSKALALTVLPAEEREEFVAEHDVENMSTRELKDALQENKELKRQQQQLQKQLEEKEKQISQASVQLDTAISERQKMETRLQEAVNQNAGYEKSLEVKVEAAKKLEEARKAAEEKRRQSEEKAKELQRQIEELKAQSQEPDQQMFGELREQAQREAERRFSDQIEKLQQEKEKAEQRVAEAEEKNRQLQSKSQQAGSRELIVFDEKFKAFQADFNELSGLLKALESSDAQTAGKFRSAVQKLLTIMSANLEGSR